MNDSANTEKQSLDITGLICPMTFVRTKLALEKMTPGTILEVTLKGAEPLANVPRSARQHGHSVLSVPRSKTTNILSLFVAKTCSRQQKAASVERGYVGIVTSGARK